MKKQVSMVLVILLSCLTCTWADPGDIYLANTTGDFYRITADYLANGTSGFGNVQGMAILPNGQVAFGNTDGVIWVTNGDPTNWANSASSGGWGSVSSMTALTNGNLAFGTATGSVFVTDNLLNYINSSDGWNEVPAVAGMANGNIAFSNGTSVFVADNQAAYVAGVGGWGVVNELTALANGNIAFGATSGSIYLTDSQVGYINGVGGWGGPITAMTELTDGKIAFGVGSTGAVFVVDSTLGYITGAGGFGTISAVSALSDNKFIVANSEGTVFFVNPADVSIVYMFSGFGDVSAMTAVPIIAAPGTECDGFQYQSPVGDFSGDCVVDFEDMALLASHWLEFNGFPPVGDLNSDSRVNFSDIVIFAAHWLEDSMVSVTPVPPVPGPSQFTLNDLEITLDENSGSITKLSYPVAGIILEALPEFASLVTVSTTELEFIGAQFSSQLSQANVYQEADGSFLIIWDSLSPNRDGLSTTGNIRAEVRIKAAPDNRSVILSCHIDNDSGVMLSQILFPDFAGLRPFDTPEDMQLRMAMGVINPFAGPVHDADRAPFYPMVLWNQYSPAGMYGMNTLRWMDFGSLKGGLSVFQKKWLTEPRPAILTHRDEADPNFLRVIWQHYIFIPSGQSWDSGEFWLTPHRGGWAKGIEVFRNYVNTVNPPREVPVKIKEGLGSQTIWMMQSTEIDADSAAFYYSDLQMVAADAKSCGIDNIITWGWCRYGTLPIQIRSELGTLEELTNAIAQAKNIGVDISPFINVKNLSDSLAERYGIPPGSSASWTYNPDLIPAMFPLSTPSGSIDVPTNNVIWQGDVRLTLLDLVDAGITNFCWDVFQDTGDMSLVNFIKGLRDEIRVTDPQASFGGEPTESTFSNLERAAQAIDYTWDWQDYLEAGPLLNVMKYPRVNCNVENSPRVVKMAFADGLYINAMPKVPTQPNGTKLLSEEPALYSALQETSLLRKKFLPYFTEGIFIGESVLAKPVCQFIRTKTDGQTGGATYKPEAFEYPVFFVSGHQLSNKLLIIVLNNDSTSRQITLESEFDMWLPASQSYTVKKYNNAGVLIGTDIWESSELNWTATTDQLAPLELAFFEIEVN